MQQLRKPIEVFVRRHDNGSWGQQTRDVGCRRFSGWPQSGVARETTAGNPTLANRLADCDLESARHRVRAGDELAVVAAFLEEPFRMRFLEVPGADLGRGNLRGNGEYRHPRSVAIKQAINEVQIARSAAAGADREITRKMRLRTRCKGRDLLVPYMNPFDLSLATKRVSQTIEAIADDTIDALDAGRCEHFRKLICDCS